jgi:hypothetical protein
MVPGLASGPGNIEEFATVFREVYGTLAGGAGRETPAREWTCLLRRWMPLPSNRQWASTRSSRCGQTVILTDGILLGPSGSKRSHASGADAVADWPA